jgi:hypothetical protein
LSTIFLIFVDFLVGAGDFFLGGDATGHWGQAAIGGYLGT